MHRIETALPGVYELCPLIHRDSRGRFLESHHFAKFTDVGIENTFPQDNHSISVRGTLAAFTINCDPQTKVCRRRGRSSGRQQSKTR